MVGAMAAGNLTMPNGGRPSAGGGFVSIYIRPWLSPFTLAIGFFALFLFAFLAAVYLTVEARDRELQEDFRRRALLSGGAVFLAAAAALLLSSHDEAGAPLMWEGLIRSPWAFLFHGATGISAVMALVALAMRRYLLARVAAAAQVSLILWGWAIAQFPYVVPPDLTISGTAAPAITLTLVLGALALGAVILIPSLYYLFRVFKSEQAISDSPPT
jgi:cytochrome d ubiquinol oxidase subunit II